MRQLYEISLLQYIISVRHVNLIYCTSGITKLSYDISLIWRFESLFKIKSCLNLGKMVLRSLWLQSDSRRGMCSFNFFYKTQTFFCAPTKTHHFITIHYTSRKRLKWRSSRRRRVCWRERMKWQESKEKRCASTCFVWPYFCFLRWDWTREREEC